MTCTPHPVLCFCCCCPSLFLLWHLKQLFLFLCQNPPEVALIRLLKFSTGILKTIITSAEAINMPKLTDGIAHLPEPFETLHKLSFTCKFCCCCWWLVQLSSVQNGICALRKAHMCSTPPLKSLPNIAFETILVFVWFMMTHSHPLGKGHLALPLSTPLSPRWSVVWCPWLCACS